MMEERLGISARKAFTFGGRRYMVGEFYRYDDLPRRAQRDVLAQADEIEARFGVPARETLFEFMVIPHERLYAELLGRYGRRFEEVLLGPETEREARAVERRGLESPPVGEEGWERAFAFAFLRRDMPYFQVVEPIESPFAPGFLPPPPTLEGAKRRRGPTPEFREMREGFWRMIQRIHFGIPGFVGSGRAEGGQFTGGLAGINTGWPLAPHMTAMIDAIPVAGFYVFGIFWPQMLEQMGLAGDFSRTIEKLDREFGVTDPLELRRGTVPYEAPPMPRIPAGQPPPRPPEEEGEQLAGMTEADPALYTMRLQVARARELMDQGYLSDAIGILERVFEDPMLRWLYSGHPEYNRVLDAARRLAGEIRGRMAETVLSGIRAALAGARPADLGRVRAAVLADVDYLLGVGALLPREKDALKIVGVAK